MNPSQMLSFLLKEIPNSLIAALSHTETYFLSMTSREMSSLSMHYLSIQGYTRDLLREYSFLEAVVIRDNILLSWHEGLLSETDIAKIALFAFQHADPLRHNFFPEVETAFGEKTRNAMISLFSLRDNLQCSDIRSNALTFLLTRGGEFYRSVESLCRNPTFAGILYSEVSLMCKSDFKMRDAIACGRAFFATSLSHIRHIWRASQKKENANWKWKPICLSALEGGNLRLLREILLNNKKIYKTRWWKSDKELYYSALKCECEEKRTLLLEFLQREGCWSPLS